MLWLGPSLTSSLVRTQTLVLPALISLVIFLLSRFVVLPIWRRYSQRYGQYLPMHLATHTSTLRDRFHSGYTNFIMRRRQNRVVIAGDVASDDGFTSDEGEELGDVSDGNWDRAARQSDARGTEGRLSRE